MAGDAVATDAHTVTITLASPNASLPYLVSMLNPQSAITPKDYAAGTTLDAQPAGCTVLCSIYEIRWKGGGA